MKKVIKVSDARKRGRPVGSKNTPKENRYLHPPGSTVSVPAAAPRANFMRMVPVDQHGTQIGIPPNVPGAPDTLDRELREIAENSAHNFTSGAQRSELAPMFHLIPPEAKVRVAKRYAMGAEKYGILNYLKGLNDPAFVRQLIDHLEAHLDAFKMDGCVKDDNLAAICWGAMTLMMVETYNPGILLDSIIGERAKAIQAALATPFKEQPLHKGSKNL